MPIHSLTQMLVLKLILQHSQLHLPTKDNQQYNQQTKVDRLIQQEEQHNQQEAQHNQQEAQHNQQEAQHNRQQVQHNQLMPIHSLTQMLVLKLILQHSQLHLPTKDNQQYNQQTKVDRLIQQEEQHNQQEAQHNQQEAQHNQQEAQHNRQQVQHNQQDKVIKLIQITLHKHNLEIKQHRQTKQDKEITKQHRQIKHSQRMLQQQRNQQHL